MELTHWSHRLPAVAVLLQIPVFIVLSIARVRLGGTSGVPLVKLVDLLMPLPSVIGLLVAVTLLWRAGGHGGVWLWGGGLACAALVAFFGKLLANS